MSRASKRLAVQTLARPSKKASDVKKADAFPLAQIQALAARPKSGRAPVGLWTLANIFAARDCQMRGDFERAARVAEAMRTFPPLLVARKNRLEAQKGIAVAVEPAADTGRGRAIAAEGAPLFGEDGLAISSATAADIEGCLVDHGLAVGFNTWIPREDGTRTDVLHVMWPIEFIRRDPLTGGLLARLHDWSEVPVTHGDGRWVVYSKHEDHPERQDGAVLAACLVWATGAYAWRDWSKGSVAHGNAKVIGELPAGVALQTESGGMTDEASAMVELLRSVAYDDTPIGLKPVGSKLDYMVNSSTAWQVWEKLGQMAEKAAARIYLGTDGTLGSQGGAPGVDVDALFGVARTYIEGDLRCIERCFYAGVIVPWTAINFGDSTLAPHRVYQIPDVDQDTATDAMAKRRRAFFADLDQMKLKGFVIDQDVVDRLAAVYRVEAPTLAVAAVSEPTATATPEPATVAPPAVPDPALVAKVDEAAADAKASLGLSRGERTARETLAKDMTEAIARARADAIAEARAIACATQGDMEVLRAEAAERHAAAGERLDRLEQQAESRERECEALRVRCAATEAATACLGATCAELGTSHKELDAQMTSLTVALSNRNEDLANEAARRAAPIAAMEVLATIKSDNGDRQG